MKALVLPKSGDLLSLHFESYPEPEPGPGEVIVRVAAVGLNPVDAKLALSGWPSWRYPHVLGLDVAGIVWSVGEEVQNWREGDAVVFHGDLRRPGGLAELVCAPAHVLASIPESVPFADAAALPCAGLTAFHILFRRMHLHPGQTLLVQGGAGGVGGFAVQLAAYHKLQVVATCSARNFPTVLDLGAMHVLDYESEEWPEDVMELTDDRGVDAAIDIVSSQSAAQTLELLAYGGQLACVAGMPDLGADAPFMRGISIHDIALGGAYLSGDYRAQQDLAKMLDELLSLVARHEIQPRVERLVEWDEVGEALKGLLDGHTRGKLVANIAQLDKKRLRNSKLVSLDEIPTELRDLSERREKGNLRVARVEEDNEE